MKKRKRFYTPTAQDMTDAAARAMVKGRPGTTLEEAHKYLEDAYQAEMRRIRGEDEVTPLPKPSGRILAFPARRVA